MYADVARSTFGVDGTGIKIGILSDSFNLLNGAATDQLDGDLPPGGVTVLEESVKGGNDEGRAMAELIHKVAPGAQLFFHTAVNSEADFAAGIQALKAAGCQIIVDDAAYVDEPFFQDGSAIQQAVHTVVAGGADYFTAAGNLAHDFYESAFHPMQVNLPGVGLVTANNFGGGNPFESITVQPGEQGAFVLQWDQPFASIGTGHSSQNSLSAYIYDSTGTQLLLSANINDVGGNPIQGFTFSIGSSALNAKVAIVDSVGAAPNLFKNIIVAGNPAGVSINDPNAGVGSGAIFGHQLNTDANTVGATYWGATPRFGVNPPQIEPFSSVGPGELLFDSSGNRLAVPDVLSKIDFAAPDGSSTSVPGVSPFFGTSAAAPDAAAVAALMLQANPALNPQDITNLLRDSSIDMGPPGFDSATGAGFIQANRAVASAGGTITITFDQPSYVGTHLGDIFLVGPIAGSIDHTYVGVGGTNTLDLSAAPTGVTFNLVSGTDQNGFGGTDHFAGIQDFKGSAFNDTFIGGPGNHTLDGGGGVDTLDYSGANGPVIVNFLSNTAVNGSSGTDTISNFHAAIGGNGNDTFVAGPGGDMFDGFGGTDTVVLSGTHLQYGGRSFGDIFAVTSRGATSETVDLLTNIESVQFSDKTDPAAAPRSPVMAMQHGGTFVEGKAQYADINGDGKADLIYQGTDAVGHQAFYVSLSTGSGFNMSPYIAATEGGGYDEGRAHFADINGDGKADLIYQGTDANGLQAFWVSLSDGMNFGNPYIAATSGGTFDPARVFYADVNGDGLPDLIYQGTDAVGHQAFWVYPNLGAGSPDPMHPIFGNPTIWGTEGGTFQAGRAQFVDVDGDGKADLVYQGTDALGHQAFWVSLSNGTSFGNPTIWGTEGGSFVQGAAKFADFNGDGKADLIYQGLDNTFWLSTSNGTGFNDPVPVAKLPGTFQADQVHYGDVNGDGHPDLVFQDASNNFWVALWNGTGFTAAAIAAVQGGSFAPGSAQLADVVGNHTASLIFQDQTNHFWLTEPHGFTFT